ncbi:MAG: GNAT family N-acetyltransferase [Firmicutes bacterium]|nr:GNAT family N-acetyltransferase [Bacillota bacterium]
MITVRDNNDVVGLLIGLPEEVGRLHIYSIGVLTTYRGRGIGATLLAKCINDMLKTT